MRKLLTTMILLLSISVLNVSSVFAETEVPDIVAETGVIIDARTGVVLYNKQMDKQEEPASTTKMITGLLAMEKLDLNQVVTIDEETPFTKGSRIYLLEGEQITVENLLYALFLESANDSAVALAKEMGGTVENFADMMNERAKELGAKNTNFINPNGLHSDGHLTTAYDLAMIAKGAMQNETFRQYVSTYQHTVPATNKQDTRYFYNTNRLLYDTKTKVSANGVLRAAKYEGAIGIKTGYTTEAGGCLVSGAERNGTELISVVMKSTDGGRFGDSIALLDWGFANYKTVKTAEQGSDLGSIKVTHGKEKEVTAVAKTDGYATLSIDEKSSDLKKVLKLNEKAIAPIEKGQNVGTVEWYKGNILVGSVEAVASEAVEKGGLLTALSITNSKMSKSYTTMLGFSTITSAAIAALVTIRNNNIQRRKRRRAERAVKIAKERELDKMYYNNTNKYIDR